MFVFSCAGAGRYSNFRWVKLFVRQEDREMIGIFGGLLTMGRTRRRPGSLKCWDREEHRQEGAECDAVADFGGC